MEAVMQLSTVSLRGTANISSLVNQYLFYAENVRGMAHTTLKGRKIYLNQFYTYLNEENLLLSDLTNEDVDIFFIQMGRRISYRKAPLSTHSINASKRSLKGFLRWCKEYNKSPLQLNISEIRERTVADKKPDILTHDQILFVIKRIENTQDKLMVSTLYETGLRISELIDMKVEDLRGTTLDVLGKGQKHRITFMSLPLAEELHGFAASKGWSDGYVFRPQMHGKRGEGYRDSDTVRRRIKFYFKKYLNREMHPHMLRHAFALRLLKSDCDLRSIQKLLGHSKIETTMVYLNIDDSHLYDEYRKGF